MTLGLIVSAPVGSYVASLMLKPYPANLTVPVFLMVFPMIVASGVCLTLIEPKRKGHEKSFVQSGIEGMKFFMNHKTVRFLALNMVIISVITFMMFWLYQPLLGSVGIDIKYYGIVYSVSNILAILLLWKIIKIEDLVGKSRLLFITALVPGIMYLVAGFSESLWLVVSSIILITSLGMIRKPIFQHYINPFIKSYQRTTVISAISMVEGLLLIVTYPIVGLLMEHSMKYTFIVLGSIAVLFAIVSRIEERMIRD